MTRSALSRRSTLRDEAPFVVVLLIAAAGFLTVVIVSSHWLRGVLVMASSLVVAGVARAVLPDRRAGLLVVRSKLFDVAFYLLLGGTTIAFGLTASALMKSG